MARVDLRVPDAELAVWRAKAGRRGLSAWIRERCNGRDSDGESGRTDRHHGVHALDAGGSGAVRDAGKRRKRNSVARAEPIQTGSLGKDGESGLAAIKLCRHKLPNCTVCG